MNEERPQPEDVDDSGATPEPADSLVPSSPRDWEIVLAEASDGPAPAAETPGRPRPAWGVWLRAAAPLVIVLAYVVYKVGDWDAASSGRTAPLEAPATLSGVDAQRERLRLDRDTEALVARLEGLAAAQDWGALRRAIEQAPPSTKDHPVVRAFNVIGRVEQGDRGAEVWRALQELEVVFQDSRRHEALSDYLRILQADVLLRTARDADSLLRNLDRFRQLVDGAELTPRTLELRVDLAEAFQRAGVAELQAAGAIRPDRVRLANARSLLQQALRWVTRPDGWIEARPIDTGKASATVQTIQLHLRTANARFHGPALPFTGKDPETWSGRQGEPIHDYPNGTW